MNNIFDLEQAVKEIYRALDSDEVLEKTAEAIQAGWVQGTLASTDEITGAELVCMVGGLHKACFGQAVGIPDVNHRNWPAYKEALSRLREAVDAKLLELGYELTPEAPTDALIPMLNDDTRVTQEDILLIIKDTLNSPPGEGS